MDCLVFLRRLKRGGLWLGELIQLVHRHHLRSGRLRLIKKDEAVKLHKEPAFGGLRIQLMLEVTDEGPRKSKPIGFC
jgi:hypothetical protein